MEFKLYNRGEKAFPYSLTSIPQPPRQIYVQGREVGELKQAVAVVGSRKPTRYGILVTERLTRQLAQVGIPIISGLAIGLDSIAHLAALSVEGRTIAVLPSGLNNIYPRSNVNLAKRIVKHGGSLVTEYSPDELATNYSFPARNRIIAALAQAVLIPEAAAKSGSLITAELALEQGKTVMAVPGNITSKLSEGTNELIKQGATPVTSAQDILESLGVTVTKLAPAPLRHLSEAETTVYQLIAQGVSLTDDLLKKSQLEPSVLNQILSMLEIMQAVEQPSPDTWTPKLG